jgi:hypothetical protein
MSLSIFIVQDFLKFSCYLFCLFTVHQPNLGSYGPETGKVIFANLGCYKLNATLGIKTTSPAGAERCIGNPSAIRGSFLNT